MKSAAIVLAVAAILLFGAWRYAMATNAVALLDFADRVIGGTSGTKLALSGERYGAEADQRLEVIVPDTPATTPRPVLLFIFGGAWKNGHPEDYRFVGRSFARAGYVVVIAGYRLVPEGIFPAMLDDGAAATRWTVDNAARFGGDPARLYLMGHSAGAYNAAMLALDPQWLAQQRLAPTAIKGLVGLSGPYDFYPFTSADTQAAFGHVGDPAATQPILFVHPGAPPMLLLSGAEDETVKPRNSLVLAKALTAAGMPNQAVLLAGVDHTGTIMRLAQPYARDHRVIDAALAFLSAHGGASAPVHGASD